MKKFAVVGHPLQHSLSPALFQAAFNELGLEYEYTKEDVEPHNLKRVIEKLSEDEYQGLSITVPYKEAVIAFLDELTPEAAVIKAVNTVYKVNGKIIGENTDWYGFKKALTEEADIENKTILMYGAGGVARACLYAMKDFRNNIFLTNRTVEKGQALATEFGITFVDKNNLPRVDIFINATSIGLDKNNKEIVPDEWLKNTKLVFDVVYGDTLLSRKAKELGIKVLDARRMLLYQATKQFRIFTACDAPVTVMAEAAGLK